MSEQNIEMEYVYIPKQLAEKIKNWTSVENISKELVQYFNKGKNDIQGNLSDLDFDTNKFKEQLIEARTKLKETIEAELTETTKVWDYYFKQMKSLRTLADEALVISKEVKTSIQALNIECCSLNTHALKELVEMIEKLSRISEENKEVLKFVVKNYEA